MVIRSRENLLGAWAFLIGLIFDILVGLLAGLGIGFNINPFILGVLSLLGVLVGFFVAEKDIQTFLMASVSLVLVSFAGIQGLLFSAALSGISIGNVISSILQTLLTLFVPATIVVALKSVFSIASN
jgi:hypothetical protein